MSERDCGKWYCQKAAGHARLEVGKDVIISHDHCEEGDKKCLDQQRAGLPLWFDMKRMEGWQGWLAGEQHYNLNARSFWIWDVDSRGKYMEHRKFYNPGDVPGDYGDLHHGMAWQLPMLGVFYFEPSSNDLIPLKRNKIPYVVISDVVDPPDDDDDGDCTCDNGPVLTALSKIIDILEDLEDELL